MKLYIVEFADKGEPKHIGVTSTLESAVGMADFYISKLIFTVRSPWEKIDDKLVTYISYTNTFTPKHEMRTVAIREVEVESVEDMQNVFVEKES